MAAAFIGVVTVPVVLIFMRLEAEERRFMYLIGGISAFLFAAAAILLRAARRHSVPWSLFDMTGRGWECIGVERTES